MPHQASKCYWNRTHLRASWLNFPSRKLKSYGAAMFGLRNVPKTKLVNMLTREKSLVAQMAPRHYDLHTHASFYKLKNKCWFWLLGMCLFVFLMPLWSAFTGLVQFLFKESERLYPFPFIIFGLKVGGRLCFLKYFLSRNTNWKVKVKLKAPPNEPWISAFSENE